MSPKYLPLLCTYAAATALNFGALNASFRSVYVGNEGEARETCGFSLLLAMLPPSVLIAPFVTGFYYHGWTTDCSGRRPA